MYCICIIPWVIAICISQYDEPFDPCQTYRFDKPSTALKYHYGIPHRMNWTGIATCMTNLFMYQIFVNQWLYTFIFSWSKASTVLFLERMESLRYLSEYLDAGLQKKIPIWHHHNDNNNKKSHLFPNEDTKFMKIMKSIDWFSDLLLIVLYHFLYLCFPHSQ